LPQEGKRKKKGKLISLEKGKRIKMEGRGEKKRGREEKRWLRPSPEKEKGGL